MPKRPPRPCASGGKKKPWGSEPSVDGWHGGDGLPQVLEPVKSSKEKKKIDAWKQSEKTVDGEKTATKSALNWSSQKTIDLLFSCEDGGIAESYNLCRPDTCSGAKEGLWFNVTKKPCANQNRGSLKQILALWCARNCPCYFLMSRIGQWEVRLHVENRLHFAGGDLLHGGRASFGIWSPNRSCHPQQESRSHPTSGGVWE